MTVMAPSTNVAEFFDSYASDFNAIYGNRNTVTNRIVNRFLRKSMKLRYDRTIAGCQSIAGKSVVDIGTGPGHYAITLAKKGAGRVLGLDFAEGMISVAMKNAQALQAVDECEFVYGDFLTYDFGEVFDYAIAMGFMDYIANPRPVIERVLSITRLKAFFSFPASGGLLAWQRKIRYRSRCDLYLYSRNQLSELFDNLHLKDIQIDKIARDYFVTAVVNPDSPRDARIGSPG